MPDPVTVRASAKVNLHLAVGPRRADGYHRLTTVYQAVSLYDELTVTAARDLTATVTGEGAGEVPSGTANLAVAAATALAASARVPAQAHLELVKTIPVAGGLAGGSADAAAALVGCDALWRTGLDRPALLAVAETLGSDVPFAVAGGTMLGTGRGERLSPVLARATFHWVLAFADRGLSTAAVYAEHDAADPLPEVPPDDVLAALRAGDPAALGAALHNDLQRSALRLRPALRRTLDAGLELGALGALVSGSGPTCIFLVRSSPAALALAASLAGMGVARTVRRAAGPVPGARVVDPSPAGQPDRAAAGGGGPG